MILNLGSLMFNADIEGGGATPAWGTEMGQGDGYRFSFEDMSDFFTGMVYNAVPDLNNVTCPLGKGGNQRQDYDFVIASLFNKIYVNGKHVKDACFLLLVVKKLVGAFHVGRRTLKYNPRITYRGEEINDRCYKLMASALGFSHDAAWFINEINIYNQDELHFTAFVFDKDHSVSFPSLEARKEKMNKLLDKKAEDVKLDWDNFKNSFIYSYLTAMRTKPFLLLAGISGTGKSRIVKEMAFASCPPSLRQDDVTPGNYCMIEVKPNWHDSTELMGYESKINGDHYVVTPFINFLIKAMHYPKAPFFVCLDEMNLAPVEQYFAEFLSVLESRKLENGVILSEPIIKKEIFSKYFDDFKKYFFNNNLRAGGLVPEEYAELWKELGDNGLRLPPNVIVIGTVNMDDTTYQFSRKVIDRAMTIEMNEVDFDAMFQEKPDTLKYRDKYVGAEYFLPKFTSARDVLAALEENDRDYLKNNIPTILKNLDVALANTPFRIAYRVENELILYFAALREEQPDATADTLLASAVDDIMMMKVLPRIEGNEDVLTDPLSRLENFTREVYPKAHSKVEEMQSRLEANHFTSFWP